MRKQFFPLVEPKAKKLISTAEAIVAAHFDHKRHHIDCVNCITHFLCAQYHRNVGRRAFSVRDLPYIYAGATLHDISEPSDATAALSQPIAGQAPKGTAGLEWLFRECILSTRERTILRNICMRHRQAAPSPMPIYVQIVEIAEIYTRLAIEPDVPMAHEDTLAALKSGEHGQFDPQLLACMDGIHRELSALLVCSTNHRRVTLLKNIYRGDRRFYWKRKRLFDFFASFFGLLLLSPLFLIVCLLIVIDDPHGGPFFKQTRVGRHKKEFSMYKFRTMFTDAEARRAELERLNEKDGPVFKIEHDPRITRIGHFLRKTSLDELPQLINVLKGEMTLVGPRPPLPGEVSKYSPYDEMRLSVTPGLTCVWQVQPNRDAIRFDRWVDLDLAYIGTRSHTLDIRLLLETVKAVFCQSGS